MKAAWQLRVGNYIIFKTFKIYYKIFNLRQEVPIPINVCIYLMGLRNGKAFVRRGAKPNIVEHGPYCYL